MNDREPGGLEYLDRGTVRNICRSGTLGQRNFRRLGHEILLNSQRSLNVGVTHQLHERGQAYPGTYHIGGKGVSAMLHEA